MAGKILLQRLFIVHLSVVVQLQAGLLFFLQPAAMAVRLQRLPFSA